MERKEEKRTYYQENREKLLAYMKQYQELNKEEQREYRRQYYAKYNQTEEAKARNRKRSSEYYKRNKARINEYYRLKWLEKKALKNIDVCLKDPPLEN